MLKIGCAGLLVFLYTIAGFAQQPQPPLTLEECIRKALSVPSPVSIARIDRSIAEKDVSIARAGFLPQGSLALGSIYTSPSQLDRSTFAFIPANAIREYVGLGRIFQEIDTSGRIRAEVARARANQQIAQASAGIAERDLKRAVSQAYYRLLLTRRLVDAIRSSLDESLAFERRVRLLLEGGEAARADMVKASSQVAALRQTLTSTELASKLANQDLAAWWTADVDTPLSIQDVFDQTTAEATQSAPSVSPFLRRFEFTLLDAQRAGFLADARRVRAQLLPQITLRFDYGLDSYRVAWQNRGYAVSAGVNFPVFDWFRTLNAARQFSLRAQQVTENRALAERRFSQEYRAASARNDSLAEQIRQAQEQMKLAEEDYKLSRIRYEGGEGAAVDVVVAQSQLVQARSGYYASVANYLSAKLDLEVAAGR